ncbi:hypothetical protein Q9966_014091 [Columba livia]|nr:hypothetical protein Q9966_014091 [Columba livia]
MSEKGELDLTGAKQNTGMWLVKVPKYLSQQWNKASGRGEVGKLRITKNQGRTEEIRQVGLVKITSCTMDSGYPVPPVPPQLLYLAYNANIAKEPYFNLSWAAYNSGVPGLITLAMVR